MPKGVPNKRYTPEFKRQVVETMHREKLSIREVSIQFDIGDHTAVARWERIYLMEGPAGLTIERRGRGSKGRPTKFPKEVEEDLLKEVQRLRAENAYLKNCKPWFWKKSDTKAKTTVTQEVRREHDLAILLEIAQLPRSTYYYHIKQHDKN